MTWLIAALVLGVILAVWVTRDSIAYTRMLRRDREDYQRLIDATRQESER